MLSSALIDVKSFFTSDLIVFCTSLLAKCSLVFVNNDPSNFSTFSSPPEIRWSYNNSPIFPDASWPAISPIFSKLKSAMRSFKAEATNSFANEFITSCTLAPAVSAHSPV